MTPPRLWPLCCALLACASAASAQSPAPAPVQMGIPPWASAAPLDFSGPPDPDGAPQFAPADGGLPLGHQGLFGPSNGSAVNLATGFEQYLAAPDLTVRNPIGVDADFQRCFFSERAFSGYASPGLSPGWVHNYDITIAPAPGGTGWGPLLVTYPSGSQERLTPELDAAGKPTGAFRANGAPYVAKGRPGAVAGQWQAIGLIWGNDAVWAFRPAGGGYVLTRIVNLLGNGCQFQWDAGRRLTDVTRTDNGGRLLHLDYDATGHLSSVTDSTGRQIRYVFSSPQYAAPPLLHGVSVITEATTPHPETRYAFDYLLQGATPLLSAISVPSPTGKGLSTCHIDYAQGRVSAQRDANGDQHLYTYQPSHTWVQVSGADGVVVESWTQNYDALGRDTGTTDADGHSTVLKY